MAVKALKPMTTAAPEATSKIEALDAQVLQLTQERDAFQAVANQAAARLLNIEQLAQPFTTRKFNFFTALIHLQQFVELVRQIIEIVKGFKEQYIKPLPPQSNDTAQ